MMQGKKLATLGPFMLFEGYVVGPTVQPTGIPHALGRQSVCRWWHSPGPVGSQPPCPSRNQQNSHRGLEPSACLSYLPIALQGVVFENPVYIVGESQRTNFSYVLGDPAFCNVRSLGDGGLARGRCPTAGTSPVQVSLCYDSASQTQFWGSTSSLLNISEFLPAFKPLDDQKFRYMLTRTGAPMGLPVDSTTGEVVVISSASKPRRSSGFHLPTGSSVVVDDNGAASPDDKSVRFRSRAVRRPTPFTPFAFEMPVSAASTARACPA